MRRLVAGMAVLLVAACASPGTSSNPTGAATASATGSVGPTFSPATGITCPDLSQTGLARVLLSPSDFNQRNVVLCDASVPAHPLRITPLEANGTSNITFLSADQVGFTHIGGASATSTPGDETTSVQTLSLRTGATTALTSATAGVAEAAGWSHDRRMVGYIIDTGGPSHSFYLKIGDASAKQLVPTITAGGRGGTEGDETAVIFSHDDQYVAFVDTAVYTLQVFRTSDEAVVYTAPSGGNGGLRTQAAWQRQSDHLYFRNNTGVYLWDPVAGISSYQPGLRWEDPTFSPSGQLLAYTVWDQSGTPRVQIDGRGGSLGLINGPTNRTTAGFASNDTLLLGETTPCTEGMCVLPFNPTTTVVAWRVGQPGETSVTPTGWRLVGYWPAT